MTALVGRQRSGPHTQALPLAIQLVERLLY